MTIDDDNTESDGCSWPEFDALMDNTRAKLDRAIDEFWDLETSAMEAVVPASHSQHEISLVSEGNSNNNKPETLVPVNGSPPDAQKAITALARALARSKSTATRSTDEAVYGTSATCVYVITVPTRWNANDGIANNDARIFDRPVGKHFFLCIDASFAIHVEFNKCDYAVKSLYALRQRDRSNVLSRDSQENIHGVQFRIGVTRECNRHALRLEDRKNKFRVSYDGDAESCSFMHKPNDQPMRLDVTDNGLKYYGTMTKQVSSVSAIKEHSEGSSKQHIAQAVTTCEFQAIAGHPSTRDLRAILTGNQVMNWPISVQNSERIELIYGPSIPILMEETTCFKLCPVIFKPFPVVSDHITMPPHINDREVLSDGDVDLTAKFRAEETFKSNDVQPVTDSTNHPGEPTENTTQTKPVDLGEREPVVETVTDDEDATHNGEPQPTTTNDGEPSLTPNKMSQFDPEDLVGRTFLLDAVNHCLPVHAHKQSKTRFYDAVSHDKDNPADDLAPHLGQIRSDTPANSDGITIAQIFDSTLSLRTDVFGTERAMDFPAAADNVHEWGAPTTIIKCWLLILVYIAVLVSVLSTKPLNGETPNPVVTGKCPDIGPHSASGHFLGVLNCFNVHTAIDPIDLGDIFDGEDDMRIIVKEVAKKLQANSDIFFTVEFQADETFDPSNQLAEPTEDTTDSGEPTRNTTDVVPVTEKSITPINNAATVYRHTLSDAPAPTERSSKLHDVGTSTGLAPISAAEYRTPEHGISLVSEGNFDDDNPPAVVSMAASTPDTDGIFTVLVRNVKAETQRVRLRLANLRAAVDDGTADNNVRAFDLPVVKCFVNAMDDSTAENCFNCHAPRRAAENCVVLQKPIDRPSSTRNVKTIVARNNIMKVLDIERAELVYNPKVPIFDDKTTRDKPFPVIYDYAALHRDKDISTDIRPPRSIKICFATAVDYGTTVQPVHAHERDEEQFHQIYEDTLSSSTRGARGNFMVPPDDDRSLRLDDIFDGEEECLHDDAHSIVKEVATELLRADNFGITIPRMVASTLLLRAPSTIIKIWSTMLNVLLIEPSNGETTILVTNENRHAIDYGAKSQTEIFDANDEEPTESTTRYGEPSGNTTANEEPPGNATANGSTTADGELQVNAPCYGEPKPTVDMTVNGEPHPAQNKKYSPSSVPSASPSASPSAAPSSAPSATSSSVPGSQSSAVPATSPSYVPSATPSTNPSPSPTSIPSLMPSDAPSSSTTSTSSVSSSFAPNVSPTVSPTELHERRTALRCHRVSKAVTPRVVTLIDWYYKKRAAVEFTTYVSESAASLASAERNVDLVHVNECTSSSRRGVTKFDRVRDSHTPMTRDSWKFIARRISVQLSHVTFGSRSTTYCTRTVLTRYLST